MTAEVLGTLIGAAIQGQIVASAHTLKHCLHHNLSASHLANGSGAEVVRSLALSQDFLSHAVRITVTTAPCCTRAGARPEVCGPEVRCYLPILFSLLPSPHSQEALFSGEPLVTRSP